MGSPFPGMDPYLEASWRDVHTRFIVYTSEALQNELPVGLRARIEERVVLLTPEGWKLGFAPDVYLHEAPKRRSRRGKSALAALAEPIIVDLQESEPMTESFIEIVDVASGQRVVTIIEVLSPTNKRPGRGRKQYLTKQRRVLQSDANLVEIDLLRGGEHTVAVPMDDYSPKQRTEYCICVRRCTAPAKREIYVVPLTHVLPTIRIPLRPTDADAPLNLQDVLTSVYERGQYDLDIDYGRDVYPPLPKTEAEWADTLLREAGLRPKRKQSRRRKRP